MSHHLVFIFALIFLTHQCQSFHNPVLNGSIDLSRPSVIAYNGVYYMVTCDFSSGTPNDLSLPIHQSTNLQNWTRVGYVFNSLEYPTWTRTRTYLSPSLHYREETGEFFLFFMAYPATGVEYRIGAARSRSILGPYTAQPQPIQLNSSSSENDPYIMSFDGLSYLLWSNRGQIKATRINLDNLTPYNDDTVTLLATTFDWELGDIFSARYLRRNNQHYILYVNGGSCGGGAESLSSIGIAKSSNALGPYTKLPNPLLTTAQSNAWGSGPGDIVNDLSITADVLVYYGIPVGANNCQRPQVNANYIIWDKDGWPHIITC